MPLVPVRTLTQEIWKSRCVVVVIVVILVVNVRVVVIVVVIVVLVVVVEKVVVEKVVAIVVDRRFSCFRLLLGLRRPPKRS